MTVQHSGNDGGKIRAITLWTSQRYLRLSFQCDVKMKLDHESTLNTPCEKTAEPYPDLDKTCNGDEQFCQLKFNEFTFPGTHNSGTGLLRTVLVSNYTVSMLNCHVKNQDLNITEMLDFGIRFFDIDTKYT